MDTEIIKKNPFDLNQMVQLAGLMVNCSKKSANEIKTQISLQYPGVVIAVSSDGLSCDAKLAVENKDKTNTILHGVLNKTGVILNINDEITIIAPQGKFKGCYAEINKFNYQTDGNNIIDNSVNGTAIKNLSITNAQIANATIGNAQIDRASVNKLVVVNADIQDATITNAKIDRVSANKLVVTNADIANATIEGAKIKDATIGNAQIDRATANKLVVVSGDIANEAVGNAQISNLDVAKLNAGDFSTVKFRVIGSNGKLTIQDNRLQIFDTDTSNQQFERICIGDVNHDNTTFGMRIRGANGTTTLFDENGQTKEGFTNGYGKLDDNSLDPAKIDIEKVITRINNDGTTTINGSKVLINNESAELAFSNMTTSLNNKSNVFTTQPTPPYSVGDLWSQGSGGDLMKCITAKATGQTYSASDWDKASKYTDDSAVANLINNMTNDNLLTISEKQALKVQFDTITNEKATLDSQANTYNITTEKTNYDNSYTTLYNYVNPLLSNLTIDSAIVGTTMRSYFADYSNKKALLQKAITDKANTNISTNTSNITATANEIGFDLSTQTLKSDGMLQSFQTTQQYINLSKGKIDSAVSQTDIDSSINNLQIGGRNLFKGFPTNIKLNETFTDYYKEYYCNITLEPNTTYTFSYKYEVISGTLANLRIGLGGGNLNQYNMDYLSWQSCLLSTGVFTFTTPSTLAYPYLQLRPVLDIANAGAQKNVNFWNIKFEKGNKPTDWTPAPEDTTSQISGLTFTNLVGCVANGNTVTDTSSAYASWGSSGCSSVESVGNGQYIEGTLTSNSKDVMFGLSHTDINQNYTSINYALLSSSNGTLYIFENGNQIGTYGGWAVGDILRIAVENGKINYYHNGVLIYTSTQSPTLPLVLDTAFFATGYSISNVVKGTMLSGIATRIATAEQKILPDSIVSTVSQSIASQTNTSYPVKCTDNGITYGSTSTSGWQQDTNSNHYSGYLEYSKITTDYIQYNFIGTGLNAYTVKFVSYGIIQIYIDGASQGTFDCYSSSAVYKYKIFSVSNLSYGSHTVKIVNTGTKNANSSDYNFGLDYFEVLNTNASTTVKNIISSINQSAEAISINANKLNLTGYITATNLSTAGQTIINGGNFSTGDIIVGGSHNLDGKIILKDASDNIISQQDKTGILLNQGNFKLKEDNGTQYTLGSYVNVLYDGIFYTLGFNYGTQSSYGDYAITSNGYWNVYSGNPRLVANHNQFSDYSVTTSSADIIQNGDYNYSSSSGFQSSVNYTVSGYVYVDPRRNTSSTVQAVLSVVFANGGTIVASYQSNPDITGTTINSLKRVTLTFTVPSNFDAFNIRLSSGSSTQWVAWTGIQIVQGNYPTMFTSNLKFPMSNLSYDGNSGYTTILIKDNVLGIKNLILQWGYTVCISANTNYMANMPTTFPTKFISFLFSHTYQNAGVGSYINNNTSAIVSSTVDQTGVYWFAIGY